jgi:hypothetical protein
VGWVGVWFGYGGCLIDFGVGTWDRDFRYGAPSFALVSRMSFRKFA